MPGDMLQQETHVHDEGGGGREALKKKKEKEKRNYRSAKKGRIFF